MSNTWDFHQLEEFIQNYGELVIVHSGLLCPVCNNTDNLASTIDHLGRPAYTNTFYCSECSGNGYIYRNPRQVRGLVTSVNPGNRDLMADGYIAPGDAIFSPSLRAAYIADFDRITFCNTATSDNSQLIMRGAAQLAENKALTTDLLPTEDRLHYMGECGIWCEDSNGIVYNEGSDYTFSGNKIIWINSPDVGTVYTIKYRARLEWIVYASPMERHDLGRNLAQKVMIRKKHVMFQKAQNS